MLIRFVIRNLSRALNYYRLKMMDNDGRFNYSPIRTVEFKKKNGTIAIVPNPGRDYANLVFTKSSYQCFNQCV